MANTKSWSTCQMVCAAIAVAVGLIVLFTTPGAIGFLASVLVGAALGVLLYVVLTRLICTAATAAQQPDAPSAEKPAAPEKKPEGTAPAPGVVGTSETPSPGPTEPEPETKPEATSAPAAEQPEPASGGRPESGAEPGPARKPEALSAAREGGPDDLKQIKGVGPKLEKMLNSMGFFHFDQIASWGPDEVAWVDDNLTGFKGRVSRDDWVAQAKILAEGGETEFSKRARDGDVY